MGISQVIVPLVVPIPNYTVARELAEASEQQYLRTGMFTVITAKPDDIVRFMRWLREDNRSYQITDMTGMKPGVKTDFLTIYSCKNDCNPEGSDSGKA